MGAPTIEAVVAGYRRLRDIKKDMEDAHKEALAPINGKMKKMEAWLQRALNDAGADHIGTPHGTAYITTVTKAKVEDFDALMEFVIENDLPGLLERRVSKQAVEEYLESNGDIPPGVSIQREQFARVRK